MNREIKFRAWNRSSESWEDFSTGNLQADDDPYRLSLLDTTMYKGEPQVVFQQYTGLKDKNGVEIYEGDICKVHVFTQVLGENMGVSEGESEFIAEIHLGPIGVHVKASYGDDNLMFYENFHEESFEIIGNIYENPELLERQKQ